MSDVLSFLDTLLGSHKTTGAKHAEVLFPCPFCHHHKPKLAVNVTTGQWHCWVCGVGGRTLFSLLKKKGASQADRTTLARLLDVYVPPKQPDEPAGPVTLPAEYRPLWDVAVTDYEGRHALAYVRHRNLTPEDILRYQLGYCATGPYAGRIIIPSYDATGTLNFFSGRAYRESTLPHLNPHVSRDIIGFESLVSWQFPIVICEGPMDAMAIKRNAIPLFGKFLSPRLQEQIITQQVRDVYFALDSDALRQSVRLSLRWFQQHLNVYLVRLDGKDPGVMGFTWMNERIRTTAPLTFADLMALKVSLVPSA